MLRKAWWLAFFAILVISSCGPGGPYFPEDADGNPNSYEDWFGKHLTAMKEAPLHASDLPHGSELIVRLLFLPTFDFPASARLSKDQDGAITYVFKKLNGAGGYEPGRLSLVAEGKAKPEEAREIARLIRHIDPWSKNTPSRIPDPEVVCLDGTQTALEFREASRYKMISRHECDLSVDHPIRKLFRLLDSMTGGRMIAPYTFDPPNFK